MTAILESPDEIGCRVQHEARYGVERADIASAIEKDRATIAGMVDAIRRRHAVDCDPWGDLATLSSLLRGEDGK